MQSIIYIYRKSKYVSNSVSYDQFETFLLHLIFAWTDIYSLLHIVCNNEWKEIIIQKTIIIMLRHCIAYGSRRRNGTRYIIHSRVEFLLDPIKDNNCPDCIHVWEFCLQCPKKEDVVNGNPTTLVTSTDQLKHAKP